MENCISGEASDTKLCYAVFSTISGTKIFKISPSCQGLWPASYTKDARRRIISGPGGITCDMDVFVNNDIINEKNYLKKIISDGFTFHPRYTILGLIIYDTTDYIGPQTITLYLAG